MNFLRYSTATAMISLCALAWSVGPARVEAQQSGSLKPKSTQSRSQQDYASFVQKMNATHLAPYVPYMGWDVLTPSQLAALLKLVGGQDPAQLQDRLCPKLVCVNGLVNQDLNPYPKSVGGVAVDVTDPLNVAVVTYDARLGPTYVDDYLHVSTSAGLLWADSAAPFTDFAVQQIPKGVVIDRLGHTYVAVDSHDDYQIDTDTAVKVQTDLNGPNGPTATTVVDMRHCIFDGGDDCLETLQAQGLGLDLSQTFTDGTLYSFYTTYCSGGYTAGCENGTVPYGASVMKVAKSPGFGQAFGTPAVWSGATQLNTGAGSMVIDSLGAAHLFYLDYTHAPQIALWESTNGVAAAAPVLTFVDAGLNNAHWNFKEDKLLDCTGRGTTAFCAFTATQVGSKPAQATPDVYFLLINLVNGTTNVSRVNNDAQGKGKDHFNAAVGQTPDGGVFVGWFDNRNDPGNVKVDYFVGKSMDGGKTFAMQQPVNEVSFDPTVGVVGPSGAIAGQGDSSVKAVWTDTRDGLTQQIRSTTTLGW